MVTPPKLKKERERPDRALASFLFVEVSGRKLSSQPEAAVYSSWLVLLLFFLTCVKATVFCVLCPLIKLKQFGIDLSSYCRALLTAHTVHHAHKRIHKNITDCSTMMQKIIT